MSELIPMYTESAQRRNRRGHLGMMAGAAALAGCGDDGGGGGGGGGAAPAPAPAPGGTTPAGNAPPADSDNPLPSNVGVDAGSAIVPINLGAAYFMDADGDDLTYSVLGLEGTGLWFDAASGRIQGTVGEVGDHRVNVIALDAYGAMTTRSFIIASAQPAEGAARPRANADIVHEWGAVAGSAIVPINVAAGFADPDGGELDFTVVFNRDGSGLIFDEATDIISGDFNGSEDVVAIVTVSKGGGAVSVEHRILISPDIAVARNRDPMHGPSPLDGTTVNVRLGEAISPIDVSRAFSDPEGDALTFTARIVGTDGSQSELTRTGLTFGGDNMMISGTPGEAGTLRIRVTATDPEGGTATQDFTVVTAAPNTAPNTAPVAGPVPVDGITLSGVAGQEINAIDLGRVFGDSAGDVMILSVSVDGSGDLSSIGLSIENNMIVGAPSGVGDRIITVTARDSGGFEATRTFMLMVSENRVPTSASIENPPPVVVGGAIEAVDVAAAFTDPENGMLTFTAQVVDGDGNLSPDLSGTGLEMGANNMIGGTPRAAGAMTIRVTATDPAGGTASRDFMVVAMPGNMAPVNGFDAVEGATRDEVAGYEIVPINLAGAFTDPEGDTLTLTAAAIPEGGTASDGLSGTGLALSGNMIEGAPASAGSWTITVTARDSGGLEATQTFTLMVAENREPTLSDTPIPDRPNVVEGSAIQPVDLSVGFTDPEKGTLTFTAQVVDGVGNPSADLSGTGLEIAGNVIRGTPNAVGTLTIRVTATDPAGGMSPTRDFTVTTGPSNWAPVVDAGARQSVALTYGERTNLPLELADWFRDFDGDELAYAASVGGMGINEAGIGLTLSGSRIDGDYSVNGPTLVTVTARDGAGGEISHTFTITLTIPELVGTAGNDGGAERLVDESPWGRTIRGLAGGDTILGDLGDDTIFGDGGDDTITGGAGDDVIDGGADIDTAVYSGSRSAFEITSNIVSGVKEVTVLDGTGVESGAGGDTLRGVEFIQFAGAAGGADQRIAVSTLGTPEDDNLTGTDGADSFTGGAGRDFIDGGALEDTAVYAGAGDTFEVTVLRRVDGTRRYEVRDTDPGADGDEGWDELTNIEFLRFGAASPIGIADAVTGITGTSLGDRGADVNAPLRDLVGRAGDHDERFKGGGGDDTIRGGGGEDTAVYDGALDDFTVTAIWRTDGTTVYEVVDNAGSEGTDVLHGVERMEFGDGTVDIVDAVLVIIGTDLDDTGTVPGGPAVIIGGARGETIRGGLGNDTITGGAGDDDIFGHEVADNGSDSRDTAVYLGVRGEYDIRKQLTYEGATRGGVTYTVEDTAQGGGDDGIDEGRDNLFGIEWVRFKRPDGTDVDLNLDTDLDITDIIGDDDANPALTGDAAGENIEGGGGEDILSGMGGDDTLQGGRGNDRLVGGADNDTIYGDSILTDGPSTDIDTAVFTGARTEYTIKQESRFVDGFRGGPMETWHVVEHKNNGSDGRDSLRGVEMLEFDGVSRSISDWGVEEILGMPGDDADLRTESGLRVVRGRGGDDTLRGITGDDTAAYSGARSDYRIWMETVEEGGTSVDRIVVIDKTDFGDTDGSDEGRDTLYGFETLRFSDGDMRVSGFGFDGVVASLRDDALTEFSMNFGGRINLMLWRMFDNAPSRSNFAIDWIGEKPGGVTVSSGTLTGFPEQAGEFTLAITVSDDNGTYDDVTHVITLTVSRFREGTSAPDPSLFGFNSELEKIHGLGGGDVITGGAGDDLIDGGDDTDTAVYAGDMNGYAVTRLLVYEGGRPVTLYEVEDTDSADGDDGRDTLRNVELARFGGSQPMALADLNIPVRVIGDSDANTITGGTGSQTIYGGGGDDVIDGGADRDTAAYGSGRDEYVVWEETVRVAGRDVTRIVVLDKVDHGKTDGSDEGRDTLTGIEALRFAHTDQRGGITTIDMETAGFAFDDAPPSVNVVNAPAREIHVIGGADASIDVSGWFDFGGRREDLSHAVTGLAGTGFWFDGGNTIFGSHGTAGDLEVTVTASNDRDAVHDDVGHTFTLAVNAVPVPSATPLPRGDVTVFAYDAITPIDVGAAFEDPDADPGDPGLTFTVVFAPTTGHTFGFDGVTEMITGGAGVVGTVTVSVTARDHEGGETTESFNIVAAPSPTELRGTAGNDGDLSDVGNGANNGDRSIFGYFGEDRITGGPGDDEIDGGPGGDTAVYRGGRNDFTITRGIRFEGATRIDEIYVEDTVSADGDEGGDTLVNVEVLEFTDAGGTTTERVSTLRSTVPLTLVTGDDGDNLDLIGGAGSQIIRGGAGNDTLQGGAGGDEFHGGAGNDFIHGHLDGSTETGSGLHDDVAVYLGIRDDYIIGRTAASGGDFVVTVRERNETTGGADGVNEGADTLRDIDVLVFLNNQGEISLGERLGTDAIRNSEPAVASGTPVSARHFIGDTFDAINVASWFVDPDSSSTDLTYEVDGLEDAPGLTFNPATGMIEGTPDRAGTLTITATVADAQSMGTATHTYTLEVNTRPEDATFGLYDRTVSTGSDIVPISVKGAFHDDDGDDLNFTFKVGTAGRFKGTLEDIEADPQGLPSLAFDSSTGLITGALTRAGAHGITVRADDGKGGIHERTFTLTVNAADGNNDHPVVLKNAVTSGSSTGAGTGILPDGEVVFTKGAPITPIDIRPLFNEPDNETLTYFARVGRIPPATGPHANFADNPQDTYRSTPQDGSLSGLGLSITDGVITGTFSPSYSGAGGTHHFDDRFEMILSAWVGDFIRDTAFDAEGTMNDYAVLGVVSGDINNLANRFNKGLEPAFIVHVNNAPTFSGNSLDDRSYVSGTRITPIDVGSGFSDQDSDPLKFGVSGLAGSGLSFYPADNTISGTFAGNEAMAEITVTADDQRGGVLTRSFTIHRNDAPFLTGNAESDRIVNPNDAFAPINAEDFFGDTTPNERLIYTATLVDSNGVGIADPDGMLSAAGLSINAGTGVIDGNFTGADGTRVRVTATDSGAQSVSAIVTLERNAAPEYDESNGLNGVTLTIGEAIATPIDVTGPFSDANAGHDGGLRYDAYFGRVGRTDTLADVATLTPIGQGLSFDPDTGEISGTLSDTQPHDQNLKIVVRVRDELDLAAIDENAGSDVPPSFLITVNARPEDGITPLADRNEGVGAAVNIILNDHIVDPDGDPMTFSATGLGSELSLANGAIIGTLNTLGTLTITVTADDGHVEYDKEFTITVEDRVTGDDNPNTLNGSTLDAVSNIRGLGGDDTISGGPGGDVLEGGADNDIIYGHTVGGSGPTEDMDVAVFSGADRYDYKITEERRVVHSVRVNWLIVEHKNNGSDGRDELRDIEILRFGGRNGSDEPVSGLTLDGLTGTQDSDTGTEALEGGAGNQEIRGRGGDDTLLGGAGDDRLEGGAGDDTVDGGEDMDTAVFGDQRSQYDVERTLAYENSIEVVRVVVEEKGSSSNADGVDDGRDILTDVENLEFAGAAVGADTIAFTTLTGDDTRNILRGGAGAQTIRGLGGDDDLFGEANNDILEGGSGDDVIRGGAGDDVAVYADANASGYNISERRVVENSVIITEFIVEDADTSSSSIGGVDGRDALRDVEFLRFGGIGGTNVPMGDWHVSEITGSGLDDSDLFGGSGSQTIMGGGGMDTLRGGADDDTLDGGVGEDTAEYSDAQTEYDVEKTQVYEAGNPVARITVRDRADTGKSDGTDEGTDTLTGIETLRFADGDVSAERTVHYSTMTGDGSDNTINGGAGGQTIRGGGGGDTLIGGAGDDTIHADGGADIIYGGAGSDTIHIADLGVSAGTRIHGHTEFGGGIDSNIDTIVIPRGGYVIRERIEFDGTDFVTWIQIRDSTHNERFIEFRDIDVVLDDANEIYDISGFDKTGFTGSSMDDVIVGGEATYLQVFTASLGNDSIDGGAGRDIIGYGIGTDGNIYNYGLMYDGTTVTVRHGNGEGTDRLENIEIMVFAPSGSSRIDQLFVRNSASSGNDIIAGDASDNTISGQGGIDLIAGLGGDDTITGGAGNDSIDGGAHGSVGDKAVYSGSHSDYKVELRHMDGGEASLFVKDSRVGSDSQGTDALRNIEILVFGGTEFILPDGYTDIIGASGNEALTGGAGSQRITGGEGNDMIDGGVGVDTAVWTGGAGGFEITRSGSVFTVRDIDMGDGDEETDTLNNIEIFEFGGTAITVVSAASSGNDILALGGGGETVDALAGHDVILGGAGADTITGGDGDDVIDGGGGSDLVNFAGPVSGYEIDFLWGRETGTEITVRDRTGNGGTDTLRNVERIKFNDREYSVFDGVAYSNAANTHDILIGATVSGAVVMGGDGGDYFVGTPGMSERFVGGNGTDTAVFGGNREDYDFTYVNSGSGGDQVNSLVVRDLNLRDGDDGVDVLTDVEVIQFADARFSEANGGFGAINGDSGNNIFIHPSDPPTANAYILNGGDGDDVMIGGTGEGIDTRNRFTDTFTGGRGNDVFIGGEGSETDTAVFTGNRSEYILTKEFRQYHVPGESRPRTEEWIIVEDTVSNRDGRDELLGVERIDSTAGADFGMVSDLVFDRILGTSGNDNGNSLGALTGTTGNDEIHGRGGNDNLFGGGGDDDLFGGEGVDELRGEGDDDTLDGGAGDDNLFGGAGEDNLFGGAGDDELSGGDQGDVLEGGDGRDDLNGGAGNDTLRGGAGDDAPVLGNNAALKGGAGDDTIEGGRGNDDLRGEGDNDSLEGGEGDDVLDGGDGVDTAKYAGDRADFAITYTVDEASRSLSYTVEDIGPGDGDEGTDMLSNIEAIQFSDQTFNLTGAPGADSDIFVGAVGGSVVDGGAGDDWLFGLSGNDTITGGFGEDLIDGGAGADTAGYSDVRTSYTVTRETRMREDDSTFEVVVVKDNNRLNGDEGRDELRNIESLRFSDGLVMVADLPAPSNNAVRSDGKMEIAATPLDGAVGDEGAGGLDGGNDGGRRNALESRKTMIADFFVVDGGTDFDGGAVDSSRMVEADGGGSMTASGDESAPDFSNMMFGEDGDYLFSMMT